MRMMGVNEECSAKEPTFSIVTMGNLAIMAKAVAENPPCSVPASSEPCTKAGTVSQLHCGPRQVGQTPCTPAAISSAVIASGTTTRSPRRGMLDVPMTADALAVATMGDERTNKCLL